MKISRRFDDASGGFFRALSRRQQFFDLKPDESPKRKNRFRPQELKFPSRRLNVKKMLLAATAALCAAVAVPAHAADTTVVKALQACSADFFKAVAQDKHFPEKYKVHDGDMAYMKIEKQPLDVVLFEKPYEVDDLTVAGYIVNDEIVRYFGMPDMHTHFWGLLIKEDWKTVVDAIKLDWEAVDMNHKSAHANRVVRMNEPGSTWKSYTRPSNYEYPEFGQTERAFHVAPYREMTMIFCSMQTAGAPDEVVLRDARPDLLFGEKEVPIREEKTEGIDKDGNPTGDKAAAEAKTLPEGHPALPEGHPTTAK